VTVAVVLLAFLVGRASGVPTPLAAQRSERPFGLPFADPPGLGTWRLGQPYGNTTYAFAERTGLYASGQGMHMGLDLITACGTPVLAIGDGVVLSVDGRGGSPPHNLMIEHTNGYVSFYGHLSERPFVAAGQAVARGEPVALTGDMSGNCNGSPHLHLEIRDAGLGSTYNPVTLIDADWHGIALLGPSAVTFQRDLDRPRQWQSIDDQPRLDLGGPLLNDYANPWPIAVQ
jgi:murein DD-endopeptidase MepM/ murein hydrolase activator NlpD